MTGSIQTLTLDGSALVPAQVEAVARGNTPVRFAESAIRAMAASRRIVEAHLDDGEAHYGINTGFGSLSRKRVSGPDLAALQRNLVRSHAAGVGPPLPTDVVRAMMLLLAASLARGISGVRPVVAERIVAMLNAGVTPIVPEVGSVGASGDLAPLAHLALPLIGRGQVELGGHVMPALIALRETGMEQLALGAKEGLAILNGTQLMSALGALVAGDAARLMATASVAAAMSVEALLCTDVAFSAALQAARPHPGQIAVAAEMRWLLRDSSLQQHHHA